MHLGLIAKTPQSMGLLVVVGMIVSPICYGWLTWPSEGPRSIPLFRRLAV